MSCILKAFYFLLPKKFKSKIMSASIDKHIKNNFNQLNFVTSVTLLSKSKGVGLYTKTYLLFTNYNNPIVITFNFDTNRKTLTYVLNLSGNWGADISELTANIDTLFKSIASTLIPYFDKW